MFDKQMFAKRLKELREENKLNQKEFAKEIGISSGSISYYEKAERLPDIEVISMIADRFKVSTDYLIGISDIKTQDINVKSICEYIGLSEQALKGIELTMSMAKSIDNIPQKTDFTDELYAILSEEMITGNDNINLISNEYKEKVSMITEEKIFNSLLSMLYSQRQFIDILKRAMSKKLKCDIVSTILKSEIEEANKRYESNFEYRADYDYEKGIKLLHLIYALNEEYRYEKWSLSEELNEFSKTIMKEVLGENNADD
ncbi:MAG: helix-turn-helix transcriptional regulator [Clostridia bacterium]|nr:helix-turn-helix transcriptional regulator [Clostridia bacterium]